MTTPRPLLRGAPFPPRPPRFHARGAELATLAAAVLRGETSGERPRFALIGAGGSGKSTLACALGHRVKERFPGGIHWFRVGAWDFFTLRGMLALRFGVAAARSRRLALIRERLRARGPSFIVLDNHENDAAVAELLDALRDVPVTWVITARRCLLSGVSIFPVVPPLVTSGGSPHSSVASLVRLLRWNPVALELAEALIHTRTVDAAGLAGWLRDAGVERVRVIAHEDDLPEVGLLVDYAWRRLPAAPRRMLAVLAHTGGDSVDAASLALLARVGRGAGAALATLQRFNLVQQPFAGRFALHATVRHALAHRTRARPAAEFAHYVALLERHPERLDTEQTHLFAAMDHASITGNLHGAMRLERLIARLEERSDG